MIKRIVSLLAVLVFVGCASVDVTKTAKGFFEPTNPNEVEVLYTKPEKAFIELGSISANKYKHSDTATMHNALRAKSAPLGADAVVVLSQGIGQNGLWALGVCIKYK